MRKTFILEDLDCANCAAKIENAVAALDGVIAVTVSFMTQKLTLEADEKDFPVLLDRIDAIIKKIEPDTILKR